MQSPAHARLALPTGTRSVHLRDAARIVGVNRTLAAAFDAWGYEPTELPMVDYFDVYRRLMTEAHARRTYRAFDRSGDLLLLRSDCTLFVAKQVSLHVQRSDLPVRVRYDAQIVRAEAEHDIATNEYHQAGVELVGGAGVEADAEVLIVLTDALQRLGLDATAIHLGSRRLALAIAAHAGITGSDAFLVAVAARRDLTTFGLDARLAATLRLIGHEHELDAKASALPAALHAAIEELCQVAALARRHSGSIEIRVDLSEVGGHDYYSGLAFSAYHPDSGSAIARGGRYDDLLAAFGMDAPAVGCSIFTRKLPVPDDESIEPSRALDGALPFHERVADARERHARGRRVRLS